LASTGQLSAATAILQPLGNSLPAAQQATLTTWMNDINALGPSQASAVANQTTASQQAYLASLTQRRDLATAAGNTAAANRYNAMISAIQNGP